MGRADPSERPGLHNCCPHAFKYLDRYSSGGTWGWRIRPAGWKARDGIPVIFCPWCGKELPRSRSAPAAKVLPFRR